MLAPMGQFSPVRVIDKQDITLLEQLLLNENGELQILSYEALKKFRAEQFAYFCVKHGFYNIPTIELLEFLQKEIGDVSLDQVIEIAAGNGVMAQALGIRATDNFMQEREDIKALYEAQQQTIVPYGSHVEKLDGNDAVRKYKPKIVIAAWCTHKYNPKEHWRGGNAYGVNENLIIERVDKYIHIGNMDTHKHKPALKKKVRIVKAKWLISRSMNQQNNAIMIWEKE